MDRIELSCQNNEEWSSTDDELVDLMNDIFSPEFVNFVFTKAGAQVPRGGTSASEKKKAKAILCQVYARIKVALRNPGNDIDALIETMKTQLLEVAQVRVDEQEFADSVGCRNDTDIITMENLSNSFIKGPIINDSKNCYYYDSYWNSIGKNREHKNPIRQLPDIGKTYNMEKPLLEESLVKVSPNSNLPKTESDFEKDIDAVNYVYQADKTQFLSKALSPEEKGAIQILPQRTLFRIGSSQPNIRELSIEEIRENFSRYLETGKLTADLGRGAYAQKKYVEAYLSGFPPQSLPQPWKDFFVNRRYRMLRLIDTFIRDFDGNPFGYIPWGPNLPNILPYAKYFTNYKIGNITSYTVPLNSQQLLDKIKEVYGLKKSRKHVPTSALALDYVIASNLYRMIFRDPETLDTQYSVALVRNNLFARSWGYNTADELINQCPSVAFILSRYPITPGFDEYVNEKLAPIS